MPTVLRTGPYRLYFYSYDCVEPRHVHVDRDKFSAKFWLDPIELAEAREFRGAQLRELYSLIEEPKFIVAWDEHFGQ